MKKLLLYFCAVSFSYNASSQCEIPQEFNGNTGSNMTVMLTENFINSLTITDPNAYVVALTSEGMIVGSTPVFDMSQTSLAIWGDDTDSPETDGAVFGEDIILQLVDGANLYTLDLASPISYATNAMSIQSTVQTDLCETEVSTGNCDYPGIFSGNTGNNMTLMLTSGFFESLQITNESAYLSATADGMLVGTVNVYGVSQTSLAVWGDDSSTPEVDGAPIGAEISLELVDGNNLYVVNTSYIPYVVNGTQVISSATSTLTCGVVEILGCMSDWAENYNPAANVDDGTCFLTGCMDSSADNYNSIANLEGYCEYVGCTNVNACNYDLQANNDDGSCFFNEVGYDCNGVCEVDTDGDGVCDVFEILGCMDALGCNYNPEATDSGFCTYPAEDWLNCDGECNFDADNDGICDEFEVEGCTNPNAFNYNQNATNDDGTCIDIVLGCTNESATNYDLSANTDNGSCLIEGCTDPSAFNYNEEANINNGSCIATIEGCSDETAANYNPNANIDDGSCESVVLGCIDIAALNYDSSANTDDGSCEYLSFSGNWPSSPNGLEITGNNSTIAITGSVPGLELQTGDYIGAFYQSNDQLICGGLLIWDANAQNQLIVVWGNDTHSDSKNGFDADEEIVWMARDNSSGEDYDLYPLYDLGQNGYTTNGAFVISSWILDPVFGCIDPAYQEYNPDALVDDNSCAILWSDLYAIVVADLEDANQEIEQLSADLIDVTNTLNTTVLSMQSTYDNMVLSYEDQLFSLQSWLTDSLNQVHADYTSQITTLNDLWDAEVDALENELEVLNQGLLDSIASYESQIEVLTNSTNTEIANLEAAISSLQADSLLLETTLASTIEDYNAQIATLNSNHADAVNALDNDIADLQNDLATTIANYDAQIIVINDANDAEVEALNALHASEVAQLESDAAAAADAATDLLNQTIDNYDLEISTLELNYTSQISTLVATYDNTIAVMDAEDAAEDSAYEEHISSLQMDSIAFEATISSALSDIENLEGNIASLNAENLSLTEDLAYHSAELYVDLAQGWNMIGFSLKEPMDVAASLDVLGDKLHLIKNNNAAVYWPEFGFNSLGSLEPGQGYQIRMYEEHLDYTFPFIPGVRLEVVPTVPQWVIDMDLPMHPNDITSLVRVVNMLGQEVNPDDAFKGEVLLYLYSDGSVEKVIK